MNVSISKYAQVQPCPVHVLTCGLRMFLYMLLLKTEDADSKKESAEDITAAATHPIPIMEMKPGVRCCNTMGRNRAASPRSYGDGDP